jgi:nucleotide-binding universal stress UspA family protein
MGTTSKPRKSSAHAKGEILWAIDPFHDSPEFQAHALSVLVPIAKALKVKIVPVTYIDTFKAQGEGSHIFPLLPISSDPQGTSLERIARSRIKLLEPKAQGLLSEPVFLTHELDWVPSLREKVAALNQAALKRKALCIALHSHAYTGLKRLFMGSFAETCLLNSNSSTLVFSPHCKPAKKVQKILFPTDFSAQSQQAFKMLLPLAARLSSNVLLTHYFHAPSASVFLGAPGRRQHQQSLTVKEAAACRLGERWRELARAQKVACEFTLVRSSASFDPSSALLAYAKKQRADLIALAAQSGPLQAAVMGATSREIVRAAECPVLVYRAA